MPAQLAAIALAVSALGIIADTRIVGLLGPYLVRWWWVIVALVWLSILWSAWAFVAPTPPARPSAHGRSSRDGRALARRCA